MTPPVSTPRSRARAGGGLVLAVAAVLAGCAAPVQPGPAPSPSLPTSIDAVEVTADVFRTRIDPSRGGIQLSVRNDGDAPLALAGARLASPLLAADAERDDEAFIPPGAQRDLPLTLPAPVCPADLGELPADGEAVDAPTGVLLVPLADGTTVELQVPTTDRLGQWAAWYTTSCFRQAIDTAIDIDVRVLPAHAAGGTLSLRLVIRPRLDPERSPRIRLDSVSGTVLLGILLPDGTAADSVSLGVIVSGVPAGGDPLEIPLLFRPTRCDAHALADDKQGTHFPLRLAFGGRTEVVTVVASPSARDAIYTEIARACEGGA